jgi:hypothetical protein
MNKGIRIQYGQGIEQNQITIGFLNHYGYLSQLAQMGTLYNIHVNDADYQVRIDKNVKLSVQHGMLRVNDIIKPNILLSYKTQGKASYDLTAETLADDIPVHHITRYPKTLQQLMFNKHMEKYRVYEYDNEVEFKRVNVMCSNTMIASTLALTPESLYHSHRWVFKPEFGAMSENIFTIDGNHVNVPLLLNRFAVERKDKTHHKHIKMLERLIESKHMVIANGAKLHDLNFNEFYNGQLMAQEYVHANFEYRIIKKDIFKYDIYRRLKLNNNSYPYNDDVIYHYPICTINIGELDGLGYLHTGGQTLTPEEDRVFNSKTFKGMLECFASPEMNFQFGSIDFFINLSKDKYNIGVYEFQPQYGVMDVYPDILTGYVTNVLTYLIKTYLIGESNDSKRE